MFAVRYALGKNPKLVNQSKGDTGTTPLHTAAHYGNLKMMRFLLINGACPDLRSKGNCSFVHCAIFGAIAHPERRREIYIAILTIIEELQRQENSPDFLGAENLERHVEECPRKGFEDLRSHTNVDDDAMKKLLVRVGIRRLFQSAGGAIPSQPLRDSALSQAKIVLEQSIAGTG
jgi:ankyrin repeat protein